ncbi:MAG: hypothetical protein HYZ54_07685 [Ignavibacteriae bacterium]|nr:hypothetical protein [Ignavibacteriota bacterium]
MLFRTVLLALILMIGSANAENHWRRLIDGSTYGFSANPLNPKAIVVGGFGRTIYRTDDGGVTWTSYPVDFYGGTSRFSNILINKSDTNVVLAGGIFGSIVRSTNGGALWETVFDPEKPTRFQMSGEALVCDPNNPNVIYTADNMSNRVFKSINAGITWDTISTFNIPNQQLCAIAIRPDSTNILFAGATSGLIFKSVDSGNSWKKTSQLRGFNSTEIPRFIFSPNNPLIAYTIVAYFFYGDRPNGGVYKTTDGGESWNPTGLQDTSLWTVAMHQFPGNEEVFVGGFAHPTSDSIQYIIYGAGMVNSSIDGGSTWTAIDKDIPWVAPSPEIHRNVWMMKFVGDSPNTEKLYMATDAGFFVWDNTTDVTEQDKKVTSTNIYSIGRQLFVCSDDEIASISLFTVNGERAFTSILPPNGRNEPVSCNLPESLVKGVYYSIIRTSNKIFNHVVLVE